MLRWSLSLMSYSVGLCEARFHSLGVVREG